MNELPHTSATGQAIMVDVSGKAITRRRAVARGSVRTTAAVIALLRENTLAKGDAVATARIAAIAATKRTSDLIPLCHPLPVTAVTADFVLEADRIDIEVAVSTTGVTGVEMEALTGVAVAALTLHDMIKGADPLAVSTDIRLAAKDGGRSGEFRRIGERNPVPALDSPSQASSDRRVAHHREQIPAGARAVVLVVSTSAAAQQAPDTTGPILESWLRERGFADVNLAICADDAVGEALRAALATDPALVITTGGTGGSADDTTPEATAELIERDLPGIAEKLRASGNSPLAALSRGRAGIVGAAVVVNLPGSGGGVRDGITVLDPLLGHLLTQVRR